MDKLFLHDGTSAEPKAITRQPSSSVDNDKPFNIGDKVLAFDVKQNPVKATVKWVGKNEKAIPGVFIVGMYTVSVIILSVKFYLIQNSQAEKKSAVPKRLW